MMPSIDGWPTKAKEAPFPHEVRLTPLDTNPVFQCLRENFQCFDSMTLNSYAEMKGYKCNTVQKVRKKMGLYHHYEQSKFIR